MASGQRSGAVCIDEAEGIGPAGHRLDSDRLPAGKRHQSVKLLVGYSHEVAEWTRLQLGMESGFGECEAIGVVSEGSLVAGVVYFNYRKPNIEMAIASTTPRWCNRQTLRLLFDYPFNQLNCRRVTALTDADNESVLRFNNRVGFVKEGVLRQAHPSGDAVIFGMLKEECRWLHGKKERT